MSQLRGLLTASLIVLLMGLTSPVSALASLASDSGWVADVAIDSAPGSATGAEIFAVHCVGCHPNGSNIIRRGKGLHRGALHRNQVDTIEAIASIVSQGKGLMSAYADQLTADEIQTVAAYVFDQAETDWK